MAITVTMIEEKEFKIGVRGYDRVEVDEFLDEIADEMINMHDTIDQLRTKLQQTMSAQPAPAAAPLPPLQVPQPVAVKPVMAETLPRDLVTAKDLLEKTQKSCDEVLQKARERAEAILKEAEDQLPDPEVDALEEEKAKLREEVAALKEEAAKFRKRFQSMLKDQADILDAELS